MFTNIALRHNAELALHRARKESEMRQFAAIGAFVFSAIAVSAQAGFDPGTVTLTYEDTSGERAVVHTEGGSSDEFSVLTVETMVSLGVDMTDVGNGVVNFANARLEKSVNLGQVNTIGPQTYIAPAYNGEFAFFDTMGTAQRGDDQLIIAGTYGVVPPSVSTSGESAGAAFILSESGSLTTNDSFDGGMLTLEMGTAFTSLFTGVPLGMGPDRDASWTLTNIVPDPGVNPYGFFTSFMADSAFTGSFALVPTPGSAALFGLSSTILAVRRRR
jgi:hypothetical protein